MDSGIITIMLPLALAFIMIGLGLELTPKDFARVTKHPKAVLIALFCQLILQGFCLRALIGSGLNAAGGLTRRQHGQFIQLPV